MVLSCSQTLMGACCVGLTYAVELYLILSSACDRVVKNTLDCCGLLRITDRELRSWGVTDQQPARFTGACGDLTVQEEIIKEQTRRRARAMARVHGKGQMPPPRVV